MAEPSAAARTSTIRVPQRGDKRALQETVTQNAKEEFVRHRLRRASDHNSRARALNELQDHLGLPDRAAAHRVLRHEPHPGLRLRRLDGGDGGRARRRSPTTAASRSRRCRATTTSRRWSEVLTRRLTAYLDRSRQAGRRAHGQVLVPAAAAAGRRRQGPAQRGGRRARRARPRPGDPRRCAGQAVRGGVRARAVADPIRIPRQSEALYLLQRIRDEAHRFAITYHRQLRGKRMTKSVLDDVPGLGPTRRKRLIKELGGVKAVKDASLEQLRGAARGCPTPWPSAVLREGARSPGAMTR